VSVKEIFNPGDNYIRYLRK